MNNNTFNTPDFTFHNDNVVLVIDPSQAANSLIIEGLSGQRQVRLSTKGLDNPTVTYGKYKIHTQQYAPGAVGDLVQTMADATGLSYKEVMQMVGASTEINISAAFGLKMNNVVIACDDAIELTTDVKFYDGLLNIFKVYATTISEGLGL